MTINEDIQIKNYLDLFTISKKRFIVGIYQEGITIYKQQIRALNILYSLIELQKIKKGDTIGIIGGGVAGLTIASAALSSEINVIIYEEKSIFLNVQYGCDIRSVHPYFYDWPDSRSLLPYTDLPVLNWHSSTASKVCKEIYTGYKKIKDLRPDHVMLTEYTGTRIEEILEKDDKIEILNVFNEARLTNVVDVLIYATGYGIETGLKEKPYTPSYWRNDEHGQLRLENETRKYYISGVGDGALIDLFRIKIKGFSIESIVTDLKHDGKEYDTLILNSNQIKKEWSDNKENVQEDWLFKKFEELNNLGNLNSIKNILKHKERKDNIVTLNVKATAFHKVLNLNKISFFNSLLIYCLFKNNSFEYILENLQTENVTKSPRRKKIFQNIKRDVTRNYDYVIIRHGTSKNIALSKIKLTPGEIEELENKQKLNKSTVNNAIRRWPIGWWSKLFSKNRGEIYQPALEFFTPDTLSICSNYVSILSKVIEHFLEKTNSIHKDFRVTLHRVMQIQGDLYFQQISDYFGNGKGGQIGRVFPLDGGIVGHVARTGKTIILETKNNNHFDVIFELLNYEKIGARKLSPEVSSILGIPIFSKIENNEYAPNLVLYLDSSESDFFQNNKELIFLIVRVTEGFIQSIIRLIETKQICMAELEFSPSSVINNKIENLISNNKCVTDISGEMLTKKSEGVSIPLLTFDKYYSFNIIMDNEQDPFQ